MSPGDRNDRKRKRMDDALEWTSQHYHQSDHKTMSNRLREFPETGRWIFKHDIFREWDSTQKHGLRFLWLHGPGELIVCISSRNLTNLSVLQSAAERLLSRKYFRIPIAIATPDTGLGRTRVIETFIGHPSESISSETQQVAYSGASLQPIPRQLSPTVIYLSNISNR